MNHSNELSNQWVRLEPLSFDHEHELNAAAADGELWNLSHITTVPRAEHMHAYIDAALVSATQEPFAVRRVSDDKIVGTSRYYEIAETDRRRAIGWTWYAKSAQRSAVNTATKLLLLSHAFESLDCIAVAFHTHVNNAASRTAILRLGAIEEGILRHHRIMSDGSIRDTVCYSILNTEWGTVRDNLNEKLSMPR